jgi:hypothetical protein
MSLRAAKAAGPAAFRAATIINSALFGALQGHEVRKAVDRGNELAPEIARARHSGQGCRRSTEERDVPPDLGDERLRPWRVDDADRERARPAADTRHLGRSR